MRNNGFSLVELVLVVAILGLLLTLAAPGYQGFVRRAHRSDAIAHLLQMAACQERLRAENGAYDTTRCLPGASRRYAFAYAPDSPPRSYVVEARPLDAQVDDTCGTLLLLHDGARQVSAPGADAVRCWAAR